MSKLKMVISIIHMCILQYIGQSMVGDNNRLGHDVKIVYVIGVIYQK